jgi:hypothetical protein
MLWLAVGGAILLAAGLVLSALLGDGGERPLSLADPPGILFLVGVLVATVGLLGMAWRLLGNPPAGRARRPLSRSSKVLAAGVAAMLVAGVAWFAVWSLTSGGRPARSRS